MTLWLDFETRSRCDLKSRGVYNYAMDESTEVLCMSYAFDDEEVRTWTPDQLFPIKVRGYKGQIRAHNAAFERLVFWHPLQINIPLEQFYCTATQARANCAPGSLEDVGRFSGASMRKDHRGNQLIRALSIPRADGTFNEDPALMAEMVAYCEQDVRAMRAFSKAMRDLSDDELRDYHVNERINDRGVQLDKPLAEAAMRYASAELEDIQQLVTEITKGAITSVRSPRMREWVMDRVGSEALKLMIVYKDGEPKYSIDKTVRANLLAMDNPDEVPVDVADVIQCADDLWASSVAKFSRLAELADEEDNRVRGAFVFAGGSATGRASSYGAQVHNFTRKCAKQPEDVRQAMVRGHAIVPHYGKRVTDVLKGMLRPALIPAAGKSFVVADWASIEARVTPWASNSPAGDAKLELFVTGEDVYKVNASATFSVPVADITPDQRQIGKVQELACLAEDTVVLTHNGCKVIVDVTVNDMLWDGVEWVRHQGLVKRGVKPIVNVAGINVTPDHLFLVGQKWKEAQQLVLSEKYLCQALTTGLENLPLSVLNTGLRAAYHTSKLSVLAAQARTALVLQIYEKARPRGVTLALKKLRDIGEKIFSSMQKRALMMRTAGGFSIDYRRVKTAAITRKTVGIQTTAGAASRYINLGTPIKQRFYVTLCHLMDGIYRIWNSTGLTLTRAMNRTICVLFPTKPTTETNDLSKPYSAALMNWKPVYDIAHAGPRNRFMVMSNNGPLIVHNCGFAGGIGAFAAMGRAYGVYLPDSEAQRMVNGWRRANGWAVPYWQGLENAYTTALRNKNTDIEIGCIVYHYDGRHLWYMLPSGRVLCYPYAKFDEDGISYAKSAWKPAQDAKHWPRARLWKGLACENITQAIANDLLRYALRQLDDVVLHVHDEIVIESDRPEDVASELKRVMTTCPNWAGGLPLAAEVKIMGRYGK